MNRSHFLFARCARRNILILVLTVLALCGCSHGPAPIDDQARLSEPRVFELKEITPEQGQVLLSQLSLGTVTVVPGRNALSVTGTSSDLYRAGVVLDLVDTRDEFVIETLAAVPDARTIPTNAQIAETLGNVAIGTFADLPKSGERTRAIIDIHGESVVAIVPARIHRELVAFVKLGPEGLRQVRGDNGHAETAAASAKASAAGVQVPAQEAKPTDAPSDPPSTRIAPVSPEPNDAKAASGTPVPAPAPAAATSSSKQDAAIAAELPDEHDVQAAEEQRATEGTITFGPVARTGKSTKTKASYDPVLPDNAEDTLQLDLPDRLEMIQLLDLVAEYLRLDYMYEPEKIKGQVVSLRLHGKLQGEVRVKDLYPLLESVLKFKGFAMTCHKGNLVTIVPVTDALQVDPALVDSNDTSIEAGDMVVTRVFGLQYINAASAMNLLDSMKLSVAALPIEETRSLIVTCYAYRMARIERLLSMIDRPGRPKEFRFRQLKYTMANTLAKKVESLVAELQMVPVKVAPMEQKSSTSALTLGTSAASSSSTRKAIDATSSDSSDRYTVYLDADERTNRILMVGHAEHLVIVEEVVDALDVAQHDPRLLKGYPVVHLSAADAKKKLEDLEVIGRGKKDSGGGPAPVLVSAGSPPGKASKSEAIEAAAVEEIQVTVLEATNSLLINATQEQHARIATVLSHVDVVQQDLRTFKVYDIKHVDAKEVKKQLSEFELVGAKDKGATPVAGTPERITAPVAATSSTTKEEHATMQEPQVSVIESTNSLLVNATEFQHARIASVIDHVDKVARDEAIPYEIYFLENQEPEHLAEVLQKILQEKVQDKEAKTEKVVRRTEDEVIIVPDKNTFSVVVYASMKNQEWISKLIKTLDRRRPQVLIDATLVEITKTDAFTYDLNLLGSSPSVASTSAISKADPNTIGKFVQSNKGLFAGFYGDEHIQALLQAMQSKDYGRVLAKPKILVNDNEPGKITTKDITYVETSSSIPVTSGTAGPQTNFVQTAVRFEPYEAGITLDITPHISEGDLLRLDIALTRSDFLETSDTKKPPNTRSNEVTTKVTVPDGSTIILGGLLKLNQNKGGQKVPILGDVPLVGGLFRSVNNKDTQNKLYVFVKAEIIRPDETAGSRYGDLRRTSEQNRDAFEKHELEFQNYQSWPGMKPQPVEPAKVLEAR